LAQIDVGIAYAVWAAVGTAAVTLFSIFLFDEELDVVKTACLLMIVSGVVGLHLRQEHD
jgi:small multidrug resistance pump